MIHSNLASQGLYTSRLIPPRRYKDPGLRGWIHTWDSCSALCRYTVVSNACHCALVTGCMNAIFIRFCNNQGSQLGIHASIRLISRDRGGFVTAIERMQQLSLYAKQTTTIQFFFSYLRGVVECPGFRYKFPPMISLV